MTTALEVNVGEGKQICIIYSLRYRTDVKAQAEVLVLLFIAK